ncbi:hypothetical protein EDD21DRAFT_354305 [Dissophora ornata]|nr:hypothetical protein EDD21DRAFT_354305 [Dissophora ornata]
MSALPSSSSLRTSRSSSTFASHTSAYDPSLLTRRASSEDSTTLLQSYAVAEALSKKTTLSPSSSAQSSLSLATSVSSSTYSSASSPQPSTAASTAPQSISAENVQLKDDGEVMGLDLLGSSPPRLQEIAATPPPSIHRNSTSTETRPPSYAGSGSTSTPSLSEHSRPLAPLYFGDYLFPEHPSLQDLRHVFLLDKSSKQKDFRQSLQLHAHLMGLALSARVSRGLDLAYDHAHDAFKNRQRPDRRNEFITTFNFTHDETERILNHALAHPQPRPSFLDMMSPSSSTAILTFLHRVRTDHSILATAFGNLQSQELDALLLHERPSLVLPSQTQLRGARDRGFSMQAGSNNHGAQHPPANHAASTHQRPQQQSQGTVPNFVNNQDIVHIILASLFGPSSFEREHALRTQAVASIFVTLLTEKKGERLMTEMLERYVVQSEWQQSGRAKTRFEETLLGIIHRGDMDLAGFSDEELNANVLPYSQHQSHHQSLGRMFSIPLMKAATIDSTPSAQIHHGAGPREPIFFAANADTRTHQQEITGRQAIVEEFFTEACLEILDTLAEFSPPCLMELSRMIFAKLDQSAKPYASLIIVVKFFFYRFMNKCIAYPEASCDSGHGDKSAVEAHRDVIYHCSLPILLDIFFRLMA